MAASRASGSSAKTKPIRRGERFHMRRRWHGNYLGRASATSCAQALAMRRYDVYSSAALAPSIRRRQVPHRKLDLAVGKLPPVFDHRGGAGLRKLIEDFAGLETSRLDRQREYLRPRRAGNSICQIFGTKEHAAPPVYPQAIDHERLAAKSKRWPVQRRLYPR